MYSAHHAHYTSCDPVGLWQLTATQFMSPQFIHSVHKFEGDFVLDTLAHPIGYG